MCYATCGRQLGDESRSPFTSQPSTSWQRWISKNSKRTRYGWPCSWLLLHDGVADLDSNWLHLVPDLLSRPAPLAESPQS